MKLVIILAICLICVYLSSAQEIDSIGNCGPNEVWNECGTACPTTCDTTPGPQICTFNCVPQCQCGDGLVRRKSDNQCVKPEECNDTRTDTRTDRRTKWWRYLQF